MCQSLNQINVLFCGAKRIPTGKKTPVNVGLRYIDMTTRGSPTKVSLSSVNLRAGWI